MLGFPIVSNYTIVGGDPDGLFALDSGLNNAQVKPPSNPHPTPPACTADCTRTGLGGRDGSLWA